MGVRNCEELGLNLQTIISRLLSNKELVKLLYYTDKDPLSHEDLTKEEIQAEVFDKLIKITPKVGTKDTAHSVVIVSVNGGSKISGNKEFSRIRIAIDVITPLEQLIIKDTNLRVFAILGQIQKSLDGKTVNGLGKIEGGSFDLNLLTEEVIGYKQTYEITEYA